MIKKLQSKINTQLLKSINCHRSENQLQGYENRSFHTARAIFFNVTTDCKVSKILAHVSSKFTTRGLSDIFHRRTPHGFAKIDGKEEQAVNFSMKYPPNFRSL